MHSGLAVLIITLGAAVGLWLLSFLVEALRSAPKAPPALRWAPEIPIAYVEVRGSKVRYIKSGAGPVIVLLHTLRTQLDLFEKMVPALSARFTVYALDYPGHGYSDIPKARYDAPFFSEAVEEFLEKLDLNDITLAGVSIGGVIPLILAARRNPRVARVVAINPYDYARGRGMARSSWLGWVITYTSLIPVVGETVNRLRSYLIMRAVLSGGVASVESIPSELMLEMYRVGDRTRHYRAFISLLRNGASWERARQDYRRINVPVLLIWGDKYWARHAERERAGSLIPNVATETLRGAGHFLPLDRPEELQQSIIRFVGV
jgi:pimeloyl-ACP methyl ester carboxylesterase